MGHIRERAQAPILHILRRCYSTVKPGSKKRRCRLPLYYSDKYTVQLPPKHTFPMERYRGVYEELLRRCNEAKCEIRHPEPAHPTKVYAAHDPKFVDGFTTGVLPNSHFRQIGFPWSKEFVERTYLITGGTICATEDALLHYAPAAANLAGGTHHAFRSHGEGYCIFNDIAVAAYHALDLGARTVLVCDLDVHQGNGTADIFKDDDRVFTFSMHGAKNYPWDSRTKSDLDVEMPDNTGDEVYLQKLQESLHKVEDMLGGFQSVDIMFYQGGVDTLTEDRLGRLSLSRDGLLRRNEMVLSICEQERIPLVALMGGGYSRPVNASVRSHVDLFLQLSDFHQKMVEILDQEHEASLGGKTH